MKHELLDEGLDELAAVIDGCARDRDQVNVVADLRIARGLDYYTGTVFETRLGGYEGLESICRAAATTPSRPTAGRRTRGRHLAGVSRLLVPLFAAAS